MARFCPYCGKELGDRSKFCPVCGKLSPERRGTGGVAVQDAPSSAPDPSAGAPRINVSERSVRAASGPVTAPAPQRDPSDRESWQGRRTGAAPQTATSPRPAPSSASTSGRTRVTRSERDARRYAPATHSLIGAFQQAGFGLRYGAWMFDCLITLIGMMSFTFLVTYFSHQSVVGSNKDLIIVAGLTLLLFLGNFVLLAGWNGQSAGMRILGIRIARTDGTPFKIKHAVLRHLIGYPLSSIVFFLGFLWMLWDPHQQGWHDKIARTIVVMSR